MSESLTSEVAKLLTHVEASIREQTVSKISEYLAARERTVGAVDDLELQKLWKALYYCFWLTDKQVNQQEMGSILAQLGVKSFSKEVNIHRYFVNFFVTMRAEWTKIDYLRLDKYYSLIRRVLNEWFLYLKSTQWRLSTIETFALAFRDDVLLPFQADGLRMHLSFIYLPELAKVDACKLPDATIRELLSPFFCVLVDPPSELMFTNTVNDVFYGLDKEYQGQTFSTLDRFQFGKSLFEIAQDVESMKPSHRKQLYTLASKTFGYSADKKRPAAAASTAAAIATPSKKAKVADAKKDEDASSDEDEKEDQGQSNAQKKKQPKQGKLVRVLNKVIKDAEDLPVQKNEPPAAAAAEAPASTAKQQKKAAAPAAATPEAPASTGKQQKKAKAAAAAPEAPSAAAKEEESAPPAKKKVSFSHFETQGIKQITKRMQDTPKKPAADFGKPAKSLIRASKWPSTSGTSVSKKSPKA